MDQSITTIECCPSNEGTLLSICPPGLDLSIQPLSTHSANPSTTWSSICSGFKIVSHDPNVRSFDKWRKFQITLIPQLHSSRCRGVG